MRVVPRKGAPARWCIWAGPVPGGGGAELRRARAWELRRGGGGAERGGAGRGAPGGHREPTVPSRSYPRPRRAGLRCALGGHGRGGSLVAWRAEGCRLEGRGCEGDARQATAGGPVTLLGEGLASLCPGDLGPAPRTF